MVFRNDEGVSPVIGVILMVAITVVLAVALWVMVSGFTGGTESTISAVTIDIKDIPGALSERDVDPIVRLDLLGVQGNPLDLGDLVFSVSSDKGLWTTVAHSPGSGMWEVGSVVTLTETDPVQVNSGPIYARAISLTSQSVVYLSGVVYIN